VETTVTVCTTFLTLKAFEVSTGTCIVEQSPTGEESESAIAPAGDLNLTGNSHSYDVPISKSSLTSYSIVASSDEDSFSSNKRKRPRRRNRTILGRVTMQKRSPQLS